MRRLRMLRSRPMTIAKGVLVLVLTAVAVIPPTGGSFAGAADKSGWVVRCSFVRHRADDPIVYPSRPGASHLHAFFGNRSTAANSTYDSMLNGTTSCGLREDKAGYWLPAAYAGTTLLTPTIGAFYYRNRVYPASSVKPFPAGLKMIAGSSTANGPQPTHVMYWTCENGGPGGQTSRPVNCGTGYVSVQIKFPDCWDGRRKDTSDHRSHMAYSVDPNNDGRFTCPSSHPVPVPRLSLSIDFPLHDGTRLRLSSGPFYTMHTDFWNTWVQSKLNDLVARCINRSVNCGVFGLGQ